MSKKGGRWDWIFLWVFPVAIVVGGLAVLISATGHADREVQIAASAVEAKAEIIVVDEHASGRNRLFGASYDYTPTIEFTLRDGTLFRTKLDSSSDPDKFVVGSFVQVTYAADDPSKVVASEGRWQYRENIVSGWGLIVAGVLATGVVVWGTIWFRKLTRPRRK